MNIVFASDDNYAPILATILISLLTNNVNKNSKINIFILDDNIKLENKKKIRALTNNFNAEIQFIKVQNIESILNKNVISMQNGNYSSLTTYARLFLTSLIPKNIEKIIYFDCDGLILKSLNELWNIDIEDYYCAGVLDICTTLKKESIELNNEQDYINAGMLLINLKKWRNDNIEQQFIDYLNKKEGNVYMHDQGILNHVLQDKILIINPKFNFIAPFHKTDYKTVLKFFGERNDYYNKEIMEDAEKNLVFLHFCGGPIDRPWFNKKQPYRQLFEKYVNLTNFKDNIFKNEYKQSLIARVYVYLIHKTYLSWILKIVPKNITILMREKHEQKVYKNFK